MHTNKEIIKKLGGLRQFLQNVSAMECDGIHWLGRVNDPTIPGYPGKTCIEYGTPLDSMCPSCQAHEALHLMKRSDEE